MADPVFDLSELRALGDDLDALAGALLNQRTLNRLGLAAVRAIRARTRRGVDRDGEAFTPYSPAYERLKARANVFQGHPTLEYGVRRVPGSSREGGLPADSVPVRANLYDSMLHHLQHVVASDLQSVAIEFDRARDARIAGYHVRGEGRNPRRDFMGFTPDERDRLASIVEADLDALLTATL